MVGALSMTVPSYLTCYAVLGGLDAARA